MKCFMIIFSLTTIICSTNCQPTSANLQMFAVWNAAIRLYNQTLRDVSTIRLDELMTPTLLAQTYGIVDSLCGWALNHEEESVYRREALDFLRLSTVLRIIAFVQEQCSLHQMRYFPEETAKAYVRLLSLIMNQTSGGSLVNFELARFQAFPIRVQVHEQTFLLSMTTAATIRFVEDFSENPSGTVVRSWLYSRPIPRSPQLNYNNEVELLYRAQLQVLNLHANYVHGNRIVLHRLMHKNLTKAFKNAVVLAVRRMHSAFVEENKLRELATLCILRVCIDFLFAEYQRHQCHPAHNLYHSVYDIALHENQASLARIDVTLREYGACHHIGPYAMNAFYECIKFRVAIQAGYMLNERNSTNVLGLCSTTEIASLVQNHYNYE